MKANKSSLLRAVQTVLRKADRKLERLSVPQESPRSPIYHSLAEAYEDGWQRASCIFTLSTGRVGTQTLSALLELCPGTLAFHEPDPRLIKTSYDAYLAGDAVATDKVWERLLLAARDELVFRVMREGKAYVETSNRLTYLAPALANLFPSSRFIHLHRHPYEVIRSGMRRGYYAGHNWDFARPRPLIGEPEYELWEDWSTLEKNAWLWHKVNRIIMDFFHALPDDRCLALSSSDLFNGQEVALDKLFRFVGNGRPQTSDIETVLGKKLNAQVSNNFPDARHWDASQQQSIKNIAGDTAHVLGYAF